VPDRQKMQIRRDSRENAEIMKLYLEGKLRPVCPECLAGLMIPRCPSEIVGGDGKDVLDGKAKVVGQDGRTGHKSL